MRAVHRITAFIRALFRSADVDSDIADELRFHIQKEAEANVRRGMTPHAAYRAARLRLGSVDDVLETARQERPGFALRQMGRDIQFGLRLLAKSPGFAAAAVTIVALGIGAITAIFSVVYNVLLRPLPFREPDRLVSVWTTALSVSGTPLYPTAADAKEWQRANHVFEDLALVRTTANLNLVGACVLGGCEPERLQGARFSPNLLRLLGVSPAIGRNFAADEDQPGRDHVVLLSDGLWKRRFGGDRNIVGRKIQLNGLSYTVIGVMPPEFQYPSRDYQAWIPVVIDPKELLRQTTENYRVVARLKAGGSLTQAQRELDAIAMRLAAEFPQTNRGHGVLVESMLETAVRDIRPALLALFAASACLLLIASVNLTNLLGARAVSRAGEFAVRLALGASRSRLVRQAVAEVLPVLAAGGILGVAVATAGVRAFVAVAPPGVPRLESVGVSVPVILASLAILVATGVVASLIPSIQAMRVDFTTMSKDGGRGSTTGRRHARARRIGVAAQIAFAVPLLVGASLLIRSSLKLAQVDPGFEPEHVATFQLALPRSKYVSDAQVTAFYRQLLARVAALPTVTHAGMVNRLPLAGNQTVGIRVERAVGPVVGIPSIDSRPVTPDYFGAIGIPLRGGRTFTERDDVGATPVAIIDDRLAASIWPGENALGKRIQRFDFVWCVVVGVVGHIRANALDMDPRPQVYWPYRQVVQDRMVLVVRVNGPARSVLTPVVNAVHDFDRDLPLYEVREMTEVVDRSLVQRRLTLALITSFGVIALVLAAVGVYGITAFGVTQRFREFAIRAALGASKAEVLGVILRETTSMALLGSVVGLVAALSMSGMMSELVYQVQSRDVASLSGAVVVLLGVALLASYVPARKASTVDPAAALRAD